MVKPGTGEVLAIAQSRPMGRDRKKGETFLNYIVDSKYGDSNGFQAGSTFKMFVLAAALEQGLPASTQLQLTGSGAHPAERVRRLRRPLPVNGALGAAQLHRTTATSTCTRAPSSR